MRENSSASSTPQFSTADYSGQGSQCRSCKQAVTGNYYRVNAIVACSRCLEELKRRLPQDSHEAYVKALLFGAAGAALGLVLYAAFGIITGLMIGYVSLAVGWLVGKAMTLGSRGAGGRRYQIAAAALTYAAVSMAAVPISLAHLSKQHQPARFEQSASDRVGSRAGSSSDSGADPSAVSQGPASQDGGPDMEHPKAKMSAAAALSTLALLGLASPFLELQDPVRGLIGLVILFVGIRIAWRMMAGPRLQILGPFRVPVAAPGFPSASG